MKYSEIVIVKRWLPILKEYEKIKAKLEPRSFKFVKDLCRAHHIPKKELSRYYRKWLEGGKLEESLLPKKRGARGKYNSFKENFAVWGTAVKPWRSRWAGHEPFASSGTRQGPRAVRGCFAKG